MNKLLNVASVFLVVLGATLFMMGTFGVSLYALFAVANGETVPAIIAKTENIVVISSSTGVGFMMLSMMISVMLADRRE